MTVKKLTSCLLFLLALGLTTLQAQQSVNAAGGNASGSGGSVSYSLGQAFYQTYAGTTGTVAEGVQQPYEIFVVTAIEEANGISLSMAAYPNPTSGILTLTINGIYVLDLSYQLYDMQGKLLENRKISGIRTSIVMSNLLPAAYFVKVIQGNNEVKTFKIIKN